MTDSIHKSVLLQECIEGLNLKDNFICVDMTFGGGGHSFEILKKYKSGKIVAFDQDAGAWNRAKDKFKGLENRIIFINKNFRQIKEGLEESKILPKIDALLFDLGLSSDQLDNSGRGFTFLKNEPLLMTMKENISEEDITAEEIVNTWSEESLAQIIYGYGEEKYARKIAKNIVIHRGDKRIENTFDLVEIIEQSVPSFYKKSRIHFATKTFQALRIAVNDELNALKDGLSQGYEVLKDGGRMCVISFHSLEDRMVKNFFKDKKENSKAVLINKKVIVASEEEVKNNKRSRSAKLRILEKIN